MLNFGLAFAAFLGAHTLPRLTGFRDWGMNRYGRKAYIVAYSVLSIALLIWLIMAAVNAPYIGFWATTPTLVAISMVLMFLAVIILVAGVTRSNSLSASFVGGETDEKNPGILAFARHPITGSTLLWALAHLLVNGDFTGVVLFGGLVLFSLFGNRAFLKWAEKRLGVQDYQNKLNVARGSLLDRLSRAASPRFAVELLLGVAVYFVILFAHEWAIGVAPLAYF